MARTRRGSLRIIALANEAAKNEAAELLAGAEAISMDEARHNLKHLPITLREDIAEDEAREIMDYFEEIGVAAAFEVHQKRGSRATPPPRRRGSPGTHLLLPMLLFLVAAALVGWMLLAK